VGEASHPGPAGSRASKRKAETQRPDESSSEDSKLAQALLQVLQDFQSSTKDVSQPPHPPNKKGKGGITTPRKPGGSPLARILLQTLQAAIAQGCSDQEVATRMVNKITRHGLGSDEVNNLDTEVVPPATRSVFLQNSQEAGERIYAKVVKTHPALAGKITGMLLELPTKDIQQLLASEPCFKLKVDECLKVLNVAQKTWAQRVAQTSAGSKGSSLAKGSGKSPVKGGKGESEFPSLPSPSVKACLFLEMWLLLETLMSKLNFKAFGILLTLLMMLSLLPPLPMTPKVLLFLFGGTIVTSV